MTTPDVLLRKIPNPYPALDFTPDNFPGIKKALSSVKPENPPGPNTVLLDFFSYGGCELKTRLMLLIQKNWKDLNSS